MHKLKLPYLVIDLGKEVFTVSGVVESGVNENEIIKTLIVHSPTFTKFGRSSQNVPFTALVVRGSDRLDFKKVRKLFGSKAELAKPDEVLKICGVPVGAVCPTLLEIPVYFDKKVFQTFLRSSPAKRGAGLEKVTDLCHVNMGSGDLTKSLEMKFPDLLKAVGKYSVEDLV